MILKINSSNIRQYLRSTLYIANNARGYTTYTTWRANAKTLSIGIILKLRILQGEFASCG